jgi:hypothetical protein
LAGSVPAKATVLEARAGGLSRRFMASGRARSLLRHEADAICCDAGPPTDWGELVQIHEDRDVFKRRIDELPAIDIHSL